MGMTTGFFRVVRTCAFCWQYVAYFSSCFICNSRLRRLIHGQGLSIAGQVCVFQQMLLHGGFHSFFCQLSPFVSSFIYNSVPLGFVCGYPVPNGELYGGSMFLRSAAADTLQGKAIARINSTFGTDQLHRSGRETIGIPVCKKKYKPFAFTMPPQDGKNTAVEVTRMYACPVHHPLRLATMQQHGARKGWQPFGVWSLRKAKEQAKLALAGKSKKSKKRRRADDSDGRDNSMSQEEKSRAEERKLPAESGSQNAVGVTLALTSKAVKNSPYCSSVTVAAEAEGEVEARRAAPKASSSTTDAAAILSTVCLNGECTWKVKSAYDDIFKEIHGYSESDSDD